MRKFLIPPEQSGYSVGDGEETISTKLDGGKSRYRRDVLNSTSKVNVNWAFSNSQYEYFRAFYKDSAATGASSFLIDLLIDEALELTEHTVNFIPGTVKLSRVRGLSYEVSAQLEVQPKDYAEGYFASVVFLYENFGDDTAAATEYFSLLETFVNTTIPSFNVMTP